MSGTRKRLGFCLLLLLCLGLAAGVARGVAAGRPGFTEKLPGGVALELVSVPGGSFLMGSSPSDAGRYDNETPQHSVTLGSFWMGKYEVTQAQWKAIMGNNPSCFQSDDRPVEQVAWADAQEFCRRLSARTRKTYRLPSEAEWEYACRADTQTKFCCGDADSSLGGYAWYSLNSGGTTHPVGQKAPNRWGLYDMHGNVWEWCEDFYHSSYAGAPQDGSAWTDDPTSVDLGNYNGPARVLRGGSWRDEARICRSAYRNLHYPAIRNYNHGFRVVLSTLRPY